MRLLLLIVLSVSAGLAQGPRRITVPAGSKVQLVVVDPVWSRSARLGAVVHLRASFPVAIDNEIAVPAGTFVEGSIDILTRPTWKTGRAELRLHFKQMVFANGYAVQFPGPVVDASGVESEPGAANATLNVLISSRSPVLLNEGLPVEMDLERALVLDAAAAAAAAPMSLPPQVARRPPFCRPVPGTAGTDDTIIPGTPGTPSTTIPGGPGMPDTTIPGTPPTPPTVIPGTAGTPGAIACLEPPAVSSLPVSHKEPFSLAKPVRAGGRELPRGTYEAAWSGLGLEANVLIYRKGNMVVRVKAHVVALGRNAPAAKAMLYPNPDGSSSVELLEFKNRNYGLRFAQ